MTIVMVTSALLNFVFPPNQLENRKTVGYMEIPIFKKQILRSIVSANENLTLCLSFTNFVLNMKNNQSQIPALGLVEVLSSVSKVADLF